MKYWAPPSVTCLIKELLPLELLYFIFLTSCNTVHFRREYQDGRALFIQSQSISIHKNTIRDPCINP